MSFFDPQGLYYHRQKSTRKGQIIQKKPQPKNGAIGYDEIPRSLSVLKTFQYQIFPPGTTYPQTLHRDLSWGYNANLSSVDRINISVNSIMTSASEKFNDAFQIPPEDIIRFSFYIVVNTIQFNALSNGTCSYSLAFYTQSNASSEIIISATDGSTGSNFVSLYPDESTKIWHCRYGQDPYYGNIDYRRNPSELILASYFSSDNNIYAQMYNNQDHNIDTDELLAYISLTNATSTELAVTYTIILAAEYQ